MRWMIVAAAVVAVALVATFSYATSSTRCDTDFTYASDSDYASTPGAATPSGEPPSSTSETCSPHFWWD